MDKKKNEARFDGFNPHKLRSLVKVINIKMKKCDDEEKVVRLYEMLDGPALLLADTEELLDMSWKDACDLLTRKFCPVLDRDVVFDMIMKSSPGRSELAADFITRLYQLILNAGRTKDEFVSVIYVKLRRIIRITVADGIPMNVIDCFEDSDSTVADRRECLTLLVEYLTKREVGTVSVFISTASTVKKDITSVNSRRQDQSSTGGKHNEEIKTSVGTTSDGDGEVKGIRSRNVGPVCPGCGFKGHTLDGCWKVHPELRPKTRSNLNL